LVRLNFIFDEFTTISKFSFKYIIFKSLNTLNNVLLKCKSIIIILTKVKTLNIICNENKVKYLITFQKCYVKLYLHINYKTYFRNNECFTLKDTTGWYTFSVKNLIKMFRYA